MANRKIFHLHTWAPYGPPQQTDFSQCLIQYRACTYCGAVSCRLIDIGRSHNVKAAQEAVKLQTTSSGIN